MFTSKGTLIYWQGLNSGAENNLWYSDTEDVNNCNECKHIPEINHNSYLAKC